MAIADAREQLSKANADRAGKVPNAPFVTDTKTWVALGIKRAIMHALDVGADGVVFGTGQQNADLYDLSKQVNMVKAIPVKGGFDVFFEDTTGKQHDVGVKSPNELADTVGKELADRIVSDNGGTYRGLDLKVGGEGMRKFYDAIVPSVANDILRKIGGGKVSTVRVNAASDEMLPGIERARKLGMLVNGYGTEAQPGFTITPEMRENLIEQGMPLFARNAGQGMAQRDAQAIVDVFKSVNRNAPQIIVLEDVSKAPQSLIDEIQSAGAENDVEGAFHKGTIYLFPQNLESAERAAAVLVHEGRHFAFKAMKGKALDSILMSIYNTNERVRRLADAKKKSLNMDSLVEATEEALADLDPATLQGLKGWRMLVANFKLKMREFAIALRKAGFGKLADFVLSKVDGWTDSDVAAMLRNSDRFVRSGRGQGEGSVRLSRTGDTITVDGKQRPRLNSIGKPIAQTDEGLRNFYAWFGDSKVVDDQGRPLVVYHGTAADFTEFDRGETSPGWYSFGGSFFFAKNGENAGEYASKDGGNVMPVYLSVKNQYVVKDTPAFMREMVKKYGLNGAKHARDDLVAKSYDGIEYAQSGSYVAFDPAQIKSAIGNSGQFDATNPDIRFSRRQVIGDSGRARTPEQEQMFRNVGREVNVDSTLDKIKKLADLKWTQGLFDQFAPIKELSQYAYRTARLSKGSAGAFDALMNHGKLSIVDGAYDADQSGGVMDKVFYPLGKESTDFLYWIAGNRAERLAKEDREHLFTPDDIAAAKSLSDGTTDFDYTLANGTTTRVRKIIYADSLRKFNEFNRNVMDMAEQSGLIDPVSRKYWEHEFYVPFYRVNEDEQGGFRGMNMKQGVVRQQAFKQLKGGKDGLNDLLANTLMNWAHLIDASVKNRAAKATLESAEQVGAARPAKSGEKKTVWFMGDITKQVPEGTPYEENGVTLIAGPNTFITYVGKKEYVVEDSALMVAIEGLDFAGFRGIAMDILSKPKHYLTIGVTASPYYKIRNLIRDSVQSIAVSPLSYNPGKNLAQGRKLANTDQALANFGKELANMVTAGKAGLKQKNVTTPEYVSALAAGGLIRFGTMLEGNDASRTRQLIKQGTNDAHILDSENKFRQFYDKFLEPSIAAYNELGNKGEEVNRIALYDQLVKGGMSKAEAAFMARDLMDFSLQGSFTSIRMLAQLVPFFNSRLQGLYKLGRATKEDRARMGYVIGAVTLASLALLTAYGDDDDWKKREDWDRDNYWWFKIGGTAFRIPKPFEIGAISTLAERSAELMFSDERTGKRFRETTSMLVWNQLSMNPTPQVFKPIIDIYANKDSFSKRPIETMGMERLDPEYRFNANTSMVARGVSTATGGFMSPVQVDHLVRGYFAWLGTFIVSGTDMLIRAASDEPTRPALDVFKLASGGLVADVDSGSSRYVSQMYDQAKELETAYSTWRSLKKDGKREEAAEYKKDNLDAISKRARVADAKERVSEQNKRIRKIEQSDLPPDEKRRRILRIRKMQNEVSRALVSR